jgi:hypothetical protein
MSAKTILPCALVLSVLLSGVVRGQTPPAVGAPAVPAPSTTLPPPLPPPVPSPVSEVAPPMHAAEGGGPWSWLNYMQADCCGAIGANGPICFDVFLRNGLSIPVSGNMGNRLDPGWEIKAGGRSLFFNPGRDAAWTVEFGISNTYNSAGTNNGPFPLSIFVPDANGNAVRVNLGALPAGGVFLRDLNRTFVNLGAGREIYLNGSAASDGPKWRAGADAGGLWGSASAEFDNIRQRTNVITGIYAAVHSDIEVPVCGCCVFQFGVRAEWSYTWMHNILQTESDIQEINLLVTTGIRF